MNVRKVLLMTALLAPLAGFGQGDERKEKEVTEPDLIISVRAGKATTVLVQGAKDVRTSDQGVADVAMGEPNQLLVEGLRVGEVSAQVARKGDRNFKLVVRVVK